MIDYRGYPELLDSDSFTAWRIGLIFSLFYLESRSPRLFFCCIGTAKVVGINPFLRNGLRISAIDTIL